METKFFDSILMILSDNYGVDERRLKGEHSRHKCINRCRFTSLFNFHT